jgi:hypothetical protein
MPSTRFDPKPTANPTNAATATGTIQEWTTPSTGQYVIEAAGAKGGSGNNGGTATAGGAGAIMKGTFNLNAGDVLKILVGQMGGSSGTTDTGGGGGGGTFVVKVNPTGAYTMADNSFKFDVLLVAGGGGGGGDSATAGTGGTTSTSGLAGNSSGGAGGTAGGGGSNIGTSGGGGGLTGNGAPTSQGGKSFINVGTGGTGSYGNGGFGGGGGGSDATNDNAGGGGGYSGGGAGGANAAGGGGGSYNIGASPVNSADANSGQGYVTITYDGIEFDSPTGSQMFDTSFVFSTEVISITNVTISEYGFVYRIKPPGDNTEPTTSDMKIIHSGTMTVGTYSDTFTGLTPRTYYRVRAYAITDKGTFYGQSLNIDTTLPGRGTVDNPYLIEFEDDLYNIGWFGTPLSAYYRQVADITFTYGWNGGDSWGPLGQTGDSSGDYFTGYYDGNGHKIIGMKLHAADLDAVNSVGFFGQISSTAVICNLTLENVDVNVPALQDVGALVGYNNGGIIRNCAVTSGTVIGGTNTGGIVGRSVGGAIMDCFSKANVTGGATYYGGFIGYTTGTSITNSNSTGTVTRNGASSTYNYAGGFAGYIGASAGVSGCYSTGAVTGYTYTGGFVGYAITSGTLIQECFSSGAVTGYNNVGGFCGRCLTSAIIKNCYSSGTVAASSSYCGGFVGYVSSATLHHCLSRGAVTTSTTSTGGFHGYNTGGSYTACYFDSTATGKTATVITGVASLTTAQAQQQANYVGWDFANVWTIKANDWPSLIHASINPALNNMSVDTIMATSVRAYCNLYTLGNYQQTDDTGWVWATTTGPTIASPGKKSFGSLAATGTYTSTITGLTKNTTYYIRGYATVGVTTVYSNEISFTTLTGIPTVTTGTASAANYATINASGTVTAYNGSATVEYGHVYSTSTNPTVSTGKAVSGTGAAGVSNYSSALNNLMPNTTYYIKAYAIGNTDTTVAYGSEITATTPKYNHPTPSAPVASNITSSSATLTAEAAVFTENWDSLSYGTYLTTVNSCAGMLDVTSTGTDPHVAMYNIGKFDPNVYRYIKVRYKVVSGSPGVCQIFFCNYTYTVPTGGINVDTSNYTADGQWHEMTIDMWNNASWKTGGMITGWRFDWCTANGANMQFDYIKLVADDSFVKIACNNLLYNSGSIWYGLTRNTQYSATAQIQDTTYGAASGTSTTGTFTTFTSTPIVKILEAKKRVRSVNVTCCIADDGGNTITEYGICYSTSGTPTISNTKVVGSTSHSYGVFKAVMANMTNGSTYYIRAYVKTATQTAYSDTVSVTITSISARVLHRDFMIPGEIKERTAALKGSIIAHYPFDGGFRKYRSIAGLKVLEYHYDAATHPTTDWFVAGGAIVTNTADITAVSIDTAKQYDLVLVDCYVWGVSAGIIAKLKQFVDAGMSCVSTGNDTTTNVFVKTRSSIVHQDHYIMADPCSPVQPDLKAIGTADLYGGISELQNGAVPYYRRCDNGEVTGYFYTGPSGAVLYHDQEGLSPGGNAYMLQGVQYAINASLGGTSVSNCTVNGDSIGLFEGTTNLLQPHHAECTSSTGMASWSTNGGGVVSVVIDPAIARSGITCFKLTNTNAATQSVSIYQNAASKPTITGSTLYTFSVWVRGQKGKTAYPRLWWDDVNGTHITSTNGATVTLNGEWQMLSVTGTSNAAAVKCAGEVYFQNVETNQYVYYDCAQLEQKGYATPFASMSRSSSLLQLPTNLINIDYGAIALDVYYEGQKFEIPSNQWMMLYHAHTVDNYESNKINAYIGPSGIACRFADATNTCVVGSFPLASLKQGWNRYVISWNKGTKKARACLNGVTKTEETLTYVPAAAPDKFYVGSFSTAGFHINCNIKDMVFYNKYLSDGEIKTAGAIRSSINNNGNFEGTTREKVNVPSDAYYFPLATNTMDSSCTASSYNSSNIMYINGGAWSGTFSSNLISNGDCVSGMPSLNGTVVNTIGVTIKDVYGKKALKLPSNPGGSASIQIGATSSMNGLSASTTYTFSADVYIPSVSGASLELIYIAISDYNGVNNFSYSTKALKYDTWQRIIVTRTIAAGSTSACLWCSFGEGLIDKEVYFTNLMLEAKSYETPFVKTSRAVGKLQFNLYNSIGLQWSGDWSIIYWTKPVGTNGTSLSGYNLSSLGSSASTNAGYMWWGKSTGADSLNGTAPSAITPATYFNNWHPVSLVKSGTTITIKEYIGGTTYARTVSATSSAGNVYVSSEYGYDLMLGGWNDNNMCNSYFRDLIVAKRAFTDAEVDTIINDKCKFKFDRDGIRMAGTISEDQSL